MATTVVPLRSAIVPGLLAGIAGAVLIDAYLFVTLVLFEHSRDVVGFYQYVASGAIGKAAYDDDGYAALGAALHLAISLAWGVGYAYVAARTPQVRARPLLSGIAFGVVVMFAMQLVEVAANMYAQPTTASFANSLVAHVAFFGIPIAYAVRARLGPE